MADNLKPCPFCGKEAFVRSGSNWYGAGCDTTSAGIMCPGYCSARQHHTEDGAKAAWNRRAAPPVGDDGLPPLPEGWETRTAFRPGGYCETADAMESMQAEIKEWRAWATRRAAVSTASAPAEDPVVEANRRMLLYRSRVGIAKYGTTLAGAGLDRSELVQHALEEALDLANYLQTILQHDAAAPSSPVE